MNSLFFVDDQIDPCAEGRSDAPWLQGMRESPHARYLIVRRGRVMVQGADQLRVAWFQALEAQERIEQDSTTVFLGCERGEPRFAIVPTELPVTANDRFRIPPGKDAQGYVGLYEAAMSLPPVEARLAARAAHFANWLNRTHFCGICGAGMDLVDGGHKRACRNTRCAREEFPRTDPVVITLVIHGDRCLLGRQARFPPRRYSPIAGFVEPGESLEAAVRREVREEVGIRAGDVRYRGSQPWPFPASLMLGFRAQALDERIALNDRELEDAQWFARADILEVISAAADAKLAIGLPPRGVIARALIEDWAVRAA
ncbi:MAG TPA: NAD(+) diphosphatase [Burkholderiales bacterium]|jgi:NAD+ diphosphatase